MAFSISLHRWQSWLASDGDEEFDPAIDYNDDGRVNAFDLLPFRQNYRQTLEFV